MRWLALVSYVKCGRVFAISKISKWCFSKMSKDVRPGCEGGAKPRYSRLSLVSKARGLFLNLIINFKDNTSHPSSTPSPNPSIHRQFSLPKLHEYLPFPNPSLQNIQDGRRQFGLLVSCPGNNDSGVKIRSITQETCLEASS